MSTPIFSMNPANVLALIVFVWIVGVLAIIGLAYKHPMPRTIHAIDVPVPSIPITEVPEVEEQHERSTAAERTTNV